MSDTIVITLDASSNNAKLQELLRQLGPNAKTVLKKALNATAKDARKKLIAKAQETYVIKASGFNRNAEIVNATNGNLEATINITGKPNELKSFKVSPATYKAGGVRPSAYKAKGKVSSSMKAVSVDGIKAFITTYASGHTTLAVREGSSRLPLHTVYSVSHPGMIGSKSVYGLLKPDIGDMLLDEAVKQVKKMAYFGDL